MSDPINWQTPAALAVVLVTLAAFLVRALKRRNSSGKPGCGANCDCSVKPKAPTGIPRPPES